MPVAGGPFIQKTGILLEVDAADKTSYPGSGTTWINQIRPGTFNGTLNNVTFDTNDSKGALVFTGSNTYVDFGNIGNVSSAWSFQVAFKPAPTASGQPYTILSYASASATSSVTFKLDYTSSNQTVVLTTFSNTGSQNIIYSLSSSVTPGTWNIIDGTYGLQVLALFKGGNLVTSVPTTGSTVGYNANNRLYLGGTFGVSSGIFTGSVAKVTVNNADLDVRAITTNYNAFFSRFGLGKTLGLVTDFDVAAFIESTGIYNETIISALSNLVLGLKSNNLWTKMQAIYPFVGGTAYSHKFNLKDPRDLNTAFRIQYIGALTHTSTGVQSTGGYMNTFFAPSSITPPSSSFHYSLYTYTAPTNVHNSAIGNAASSFNNIYYSPSYGNGNSGPQFSLLQNTSSPGTAGLGYSIISRLDTTKSTLYRYWTSGNFTDDNTNAFSNTLPNNSITILDGLGYSNYNGIINFVTLGAGLTSTETSTFNTIVRNFNLALSRNIV